MTSSSSSSSSTRAMPGSLGGWRKRAAVTLCCLSLSSVAAPLSAQRGGGRDDEVRMEVKGFVMTDLGYQINPSDPDFFDVLRPTRLPAFEREFGVGGRLYYGVRQTRLTFAADVPTEAGTVHTLFEFNLFGGGTDVGQTTFRLRHAWAEIGKFGAGQTWSVFMDPDVSPATLEYWGPNALVWFRNVQLRYTPVRGDTRFMLALERPGASGDDGRYADRIELENIEPRFPLPDFTAAYRLAVGSDSHVRLAGLLRYLRWDDLLVDDPFDLSGKGWGWGLNLSSKADLGDVVFKLQGVYGRGIGNYLNDAPADVAPRNNFLDPVRPIVGELLPVLGVVAFLEVPWNEKLSSTLGYSYVDIDNSSGQADDAFSSGDYALANLRYFPAEGIMLGSEIQYGSRDNFRSGFDADNLRFQFSAKLDFGVEIRQPMRRRN